MLEVDDILPSPLTPLVLAPTLPEPVSEMQIPALFTMAQSSPQPKSVDTGNYARVNPLPSPATSSSSSSELHLYIDSDTSSSSVPLGPQSSSQKQLLHGAIQRPQPPPLFSIAHTASSAAQPPLPRPTSIPSCADEVATAEQSGRSTPETVVPNWAYSGRIRGSRQRSQPMVYPPPVMPTPLTQRPPVPSPWYGPTIPPLRPQQPSPQPPPYDRPTSTDNYPFTDPSLRRLPLARVQEIYPVRSPPIQASQSPARHEAQSTHPLVQNEIPLRRHKASPTGHRDQISDSTSSRTLLGSTLSKEFMCRSVLITPLPHLNIPSSQQQVPAL